MRTDDFDFNLPRELIAQHPVSPRDAARLLTVGETLQDRFIGDLPALLQPGDILVVNDTKVIPARLTGRRRRGGQSGAKVEVTLHKAQGPQEWLAFARPAKKLTPGDRIDFAEELWAEVAAKQEAGEVTLTFNLDGAALMAALERHGVMPLPPYIQRADSGDAQDLSDYQTLFAAQRGAVAAPTAGLHFTPGLLQGCRERGIELAKLTLHVGAGTFLPVKTEKAEDHRMHAESGSLSVESVAAIDAARARGGRVVAVGTTALRLLESAVDATGKLQPFAGETDIFILPGYRFQAVDLLLTNFHLPRSTLFMLVAAFAGLERMQAAYAHAIAEAYRFYSYGDACLLSREAPK